MATSPPVKYVRQANYTDFTTAHPTDQQSGTSLDADFGAVLTSNNQIIDRLAQIQRSDGALFNAIVTPDSLSTTTLALMAGTGTVRGAWLSATAYAVKDLVTQGGQTYICVTAHTSGVFATDLTAVKWMLFSLSLSPISVDATNGLVGINMVPVNVFDIVQSGANAPAIGQIKNVNAGNAARASWQAFNGTSTISLSMMGTGFTPANVLKAGGGVISADGPGGLTLNTSANQPVVIGVNNVQVAAFTATLTTFANRTSFGQAAEACSTSGAVGIGGTLSLGVTGGGAGGWPGLAIVSNTDAGNASNRTHAVYVVVARGATATFTAIGGTPTAAGTGAAFTMSSTGAGTITMTNTSGIATLAEITFFGSLAS